MLRYNKRGWLKLGIIFPPVKVRSTKKELHAPTSTTETNKSYLQIERCDKMVDTTLPHPAY